MEKITLKPDIKELLHKNSDPGVFFDVLTCHGANHQEKNLGSLVIIAHVKYSEEDLGYVVSLVSSLAKREFYSAASVQEQDAKASFERTLKKLNDVLHDFFENKNLKLNIGLMAISGDNVYISRLGKFKIALARNDNYIDVLNNIDLFNKDTEGETQFANIISGKLQPDDKLLAYFPARPITSREKQLNPLFVKEDQDLFSQKIAQLAANAVNFEYCGAHITIQKIKEIPISTRSPYRTMAASTGISIEDKNEPTDHDDDADKQTDTPMPTRPTQSELNKAKVKTNDQPADLPDVPDQSRIIPAELSMTKRAGILTPINSQLSKFKHLGSLNGRAQLRGFLVLALIVAVPLAAFVIIRTRSGSGQSKAAYNKSYENFRLAQSQLGQNDIKNARLALISAISVLEGLSSDKKIDGLRDDINRTLNTIDRTSDKQPALFSDLNAMGMQAGTGGRLVSAVGSTSYIVNGQTLVSAGENTKTDLDQFKENPLYLIAIPDSVAGFNGIGYFGVLDIESKKIKHYTLKDPTAVKAAVTYEGNLYVASGENIYKYADATTGGAVRQEWSKEPVSGNIISLAIDGDVFALTDDGKLEKYFKGKKESSYDLQTKPSPSARIFTGKDSAFIYLADKAVSRVYIFEKSNGSLKTTYDLASVGTIDDISVSPDGTVWILSGDNKVWVVR